MDIKSVESPANLDCAKKGEEPARNGLAVLIRNEILELSISRRSRVTGSSFAYLVGRWRGHALLVTFIDPMIR